MEDSYKNIIIVICFIYFVEVYFCCHFMNRIYKGNDRLNFPHQPAYHSTGNRKKKNDFLLLQVEEKTIRAN